MKALRQHAHSDHQAEHQPAASRPGARVLPSLVAPTRSPLVRAEPIQAKLSVQAADDHYEREADRIADRVVSAPERGLATPLAATPLIRRVAAPPPTASPLQRKTADDKQSKDDEDDTAQTRSEPLQRKRAGTDDAKDDEDDTAQMRSEVVQRDAADSDASDDEDDTAQTRAEAVQRDAAGSDASDDEHDMAQTRAEAVQRKSADADEPDDDEDTAAQTKAHPAANARRRVGKGIETQIRAIRGGGRPLPPPARRFMEGRFGTDFGRVRIHTDNAAARLNRALNARAFTVGHDIFFNHGRFDPHSRGGRHLLAHELAHVLQQRHGEIRRRAAAPEPQPAAAPPAAVPTAEPQARTKAPPPVPAQAQARRRPDQSTAPAKGAAADPAKVKLDTRLPGHDTKADAPAAEPTKPVEALSMEGNTEQSMQRFLQASPSRMAASWAKLGNALTAKQGPEQRALEQQLPPLQARLSGTVPKASEVKDATRKPDAATIDDAVSGPEPAAPVATPHRDRTDPPNNERTSDQIERQPSTGFFAWLRRRFSGLLNAIRTTDPGVNTRAGAAPKVDIRGKADPGRARRQRKQADGNIHREQQQTKQQIARHPGQQQIQPIALSDDVPVKLGEDAKATAVVTEPADSLDAYVAMALPEHVRKDADASLAPQLKGRLEQPKQRLQQALATRDNGRKAAVARARHQAVALNTKADKDQAAKVLGARGQVAKQQLAEMGQANAATADFKRTTDTEQTSAKSEIDTRITRDQKKAAADLAEAERQAREKKRKAEEQAKQKKQALAQSAKGRSWWSRAASAIKRSVRSVTTAIANGFKAMRNAVKGLIDKVKHAVVGLIRAARTWVVKRLGRFGTWLKGKLQSAMRTLRTGWNRFKTWAGKTVSRIGKALKAAGQALKKGVVWLAKGVGKVVGGIVTGSRATFAGVVAFTGAILKGDFKGAPRAALLAVCKTLGVNPKPIFDFMERARDKLASILANPKRFAKNVGAAMEMGLQLFRKNFRKHIIGGLVGWITGAVSSGNISLPTKKTWGAAEYFSMTAQILGATKDNIRERLQRKLGPRGAKIIGIIEQQLPLAKALLTKGPIVLWKKVKDKLGDLKQKVMAKLTEWLSLRAIKAGVIWILKLINPVTAIIAAIKLLFDVVIWLIENRKRIVEFIKSIYESVTSIAAGKIAKAAKHIEATLGRTVPMVIGFLAMLVNLGDIGAGIRKALSVVQKPIQRAVDRVVASLARMARKLIKRSQQRRTVSRETDVSAADRRRHKHYAQEISKQLRALSPKPKESFERFRTTVSERAQALMRRYQKKVRRGIRVTITLSPLETDKGDNDVDVRIRIAPNSENQETSVDYKPLFKPHIGPFKVGSLMFEIRKRHADGGLPKGDVLGQRPRQSGDRYGIGAAMALTKLAGAGHRPDISVLLISATSYQRAQELDNFYREILKNVHGDQGRVGGIVVKDANAEPNDEALEGGLYRGFKFRDAKLAAFLKNQQPDDNNHKIGNPILSPSNSLKPVTYATQEVKSMIIAATWAKVEEQVRKGFRIQDEAKKRVQIEEFLRKRKVKKNGRYALIWIKQGDISSAEKGWHYTAKELVDTVVDEAASKSRGPVLIGDKPRFRVDGVKRRRLSNYWQKADYPLKQDGRLGQTAVMRWIADNTKSVSLGMRSGILEANALMGIPSFYFEEKGTATAARMEAWIRNIPSFHRIVLRFPPGEAQRKRFENEITTALVTSSLSKTWKAAASSKGGTEEEQKRTYRDFRTAYLDRIRAKLNALEDKRSFGLSSREVAVVGIVLRMRANLLGRLQEELNKDIYREFEKQERSEVARIIGPRNKPVPDPAFTKKRKR